MSLLSQLFKEAMERPALMPEFGVDEATSSGANQDVGETVVEESPASGVVGTPTNASAVGGTSTEEASGTVGGTSTREVSGTVGDTYNGEASGTVGGTSIGEASGTVGGTSTGEASRTVVGTSTGEAAGTAIVGTPTIETAGGAPSSDIETAGGAPSRDIETAGGALPNDNGGIPTIKDIGEVTASDIGTVETEEGTSNVTDIDNKKGNDQAEDVTGQAVANEMEQLSIEEAIAEAIATDIRGTDAYDATAGEPRISKETLTLIDRIAAAIAAKAGFDLLMVANMLTAAVPYHELDPPGDENSKHEHRVQWEWRVQEELKKMLGGLNLARFGIRKTICAAVGPIEGIRFHDPVRAETLFEQPGREPVPLEESFFAYMSPTDNGGMLIPGKLVMTAEGPNFEPSKHFTKALTDATLLALEKEMKAKGHNVYQTFQREKGLHHKAHPEAQGTLCPFMLLEEDFEWVKKPSSKQVTEFEWVCQVCGGRHSLQVVE